jgi:hypothetical protein
MPRTTSDTPKFRRKQKVVAVADLPGVPTATEGVVYYEAGLRWFRYHVRFANGVELANVDGGDLVTVEEWQQRQYDQRVAEIEARREASALEVATTTGPARH